MHQVDLCKCDMPGNSSEVMTMSSAPDHDQQDAQAADGRAPQAAADAGGGLVFWLILATAVGLLVLAFAARELWLGKPDLNALPRLSEISLLPVATDGKQVTLDDLKGKVVMLNFWGTWCGPCVQEFPEMLKLEKRYRDRDDFRLLLVSCESPQGTPPSIETLRKDTQAFLDKRFVEMPIYLDPDRKTRDAVGAVMEMRFFPTTLLLDRQQRIRGRWENAQNEETLAAAIDKLLEEKGD
jgi:thiol-disulfide isomerase/thioredoxin